MSQRSSIGSSFAASGECRRRSLRKQPLSALLIETNIRYKMRKLSLESMKAASDAATSPGRKLDALVVRYLVVKYGMWSFFICISFAIAVWQIYMLIVNFTAKPHYISNSFFEHEAKPIFPNVTVCNFNRVNITKANELGLSNAAIENLFMSLVTTYQIRSTEYPEIAAKGSADWKLFKQQKRIDKTIQDDPAKLLLYLGHTCESTFVECLFGSKKFDCCAGARQILNAEYGACWVLNPPIFSNSSTAEPRQPWRGISGGLKVVVDPSLNYYLQNVTMNNFLEDGLLVAPTFNPHEGYYPNFVAISPGTHARVAMSKRIRKSTQPQFQIFERDCKDNGILRYVNGFYDQSSCEDDCQEFAVIQACQCYQLQELKIDPGVPGCDGDQMSNCVDNLDDAWINFDNVSPLRACLDSCKPTCERIVDIATVTSLNAYPSKGDAVIELLKNAFGRDYSDDVQQVRSLILLDVFYPTVYYTMIEQTEKITMFELIGNIGGHLGLWLGVSLLSAAHMVGSLLQWAKAFRDARRDRNMRIQPTTTAINVLSADMDAAAAVARAPTPEKKQLY